ncbi:hypothetical protein B0H11DRAFT_1918075 [Mycena galericulata]|nr:hypothetical protein B0H11DRAFT_1917987 [Mycena galericulata]KAJ7475385.1 hypothetical protein B0H11DRAFT_1918075 [Mycena galericulata]
MSVGRGSIAGGFWRRVVNWAGVASRAVIDVLVVGVIGLYMDSSKWLVEMDEAGTNEKTEKGNRDGPFGVEILRESGGSTVVKHSEVGRRKAYEELDRNIADGLADGVGAESI